MNKLILVGAVLISFTFGIAIHQTNQVDFSGKLESNTILVLHVDREERTLDVKFKTVLELMSEGNYELKLFLNESNSPSISGNGSRTYGRYVFEDNTLSLYEKGHHSFRSSEGDRPFWEKVIVGPGLIAGERARIHPFSNGFILFKKNGALLYTPSK